MSNTELEPKSFKKFLGFSFAFKKPISPTEKNINSSQISSPIQTTVVPEKSEAFRLHQEQAQRNAKQQEVKQKLDALFNGLVSAKDEPKALMVLERGYQIDSEQAVCLMKSNFKDTKFHEAILKRYDSHIKEEISSTIQDLIKRLKTPCQSSFDADDDDNNESYERQESISDFMTKATAVWKYTNQMENLKDAEYALQFKDDCNNLKEVLMYHHYEDSYIYDGVSEEQFMNLLDDYISFIEKEHQSKILDKFSQELDSYALGFNNFETVKENMVSGMLESVKKFNEFDLPTEAQKLMNEITEVSNEISPHTLSVEQTLEFNNLYKKRFPQVLEEYVSISPRYKEKLKSHDENPDNILIESLFEIKGKLDEIFEVVQGNKHTRQKITRHYLKSM